MQIRNFENVDRAKVIALWRECGLVIVGKNDPEADIDFVAASPNATILVGVADGRIAATAMVGHDGHRGWLYYVAVAPSLRRQGLGRRMVAEAEAWLRQRGAPKVQLMIRETNTAMAAFYAHLGYETIPRIVMQKVLRSITMHADDPST